MDQTDIVWAESDRAERGKRPSDSAQRKLAEKVRAAGLAERVASIEDRPARTSSADHGRQAIAVVLHDNPVGHVLPVPHRTMHAIRIAV